VGVTSYKTLCKRCRPEKEGDPVDIEEWVKASGEFWWLFWDGRGLMVIRCS
jgi:hypothetical protein